jgi:ubiquinone/menaquinone biosynthesis C-methylase UbiE
MRNASNPLYQVATRKLLIPWALQGLCPTGEALEIGAGTGAVARELLTEFPDLSLVVTDRDAGMVADAERRLASWPERARVEQADAAALPYHDGRFALVLSFAMLHHVIHWERAVAETVRVLRPQGKFVGFDLLHVLSIGPQRRHETGPRVQGHRHEGSKASAIRIIDPEEFKQELSRLPMIDIRVRQSFGRLTFRFIGTRAE